MSAQAEQTRGENSPKKEYQQPELTVWGSVTELTAAGCTTPAQDGMHGSIEKAGGPPDHASAEC
jgi:hypothetical protein